MEQFIRKSIIILMVCSSMLSGCAGGSTGTATEQSGEEQPEVSVSADPETLFASEPNPASMEVTLEEGTSATSTIGPEGGSLVTTDKNGTKYTLTIPDGALISPIEIGMTPIANAEGKPMGDTFLAGVDLQPEGLAFLKLVNLEISGDVVEEGAVGFASTSDGQDLHLTPYDSNSGSLAVSIAHFSDPGAAKDDLVEILKPFVPEDDRAKLDQFLADATDELAFRVLEAYLSDLMPEQRFDDYDGWVIVTEKIELALQRLAEAEYREWSDEQADRIRKLWGEDLRQWVDTTMAVSRSLVEDCQRGNIAFGAGILQMRDVTDDIWRADFYDFTELLDQLDQDYRDCVQFDILYQATVTTEGYYQGENLYSDISLYAEAGIRSEDESHIKTADLNVDYITGIWADACEPRPGKAHLTFDLDMGTPNLGLPMSNALESFKAYVSITDPVFIDCAPTGFQLSADAQAPFHGGALDTLNEERATNSECEQGCYWEFELEYDPEGSIIAQFSELYVKFSVSEVNYTLSQIVNILLPGTSE